MALGRKHALIKEDVVMSPEARQFLDELMSDLEELVVYGDSVATNLQVDRTKIKNKKYFLLNAFAVIHQKALGVIALLKANQANVASTVFRSLWEVLITVEFVYLERDNNNLKVLSILGLEQSKKAWAGIQTLRHDYPRADTWKRTISDTQLTNHVNRIVAAITSFKAANPWYQSDKFSSLLKRMKHIDDERRRVRPNMRALLQMNYRSVYHLLSGDVHGEFSALFSSARATPQGISIDLESSGKTAMQVAATTFAAYLAILIIFSRKLEIDNRSELSDLKDKTKTHSTKFKDLETRGLI